MRFNEFNISEDIAPKVWRDPRTGVMSSNPPPGVGNNIGSAGNTRPGVSTPMNNQLGTLGKVTPGEPTMGQNVTSQQKTVAPSTAQKTIPPSANYRQNALDASGQLNQPRSTTPPASISPSDRYRQNAMDVAQPKSGAMPNPSATKAGIGAGVKTLGRKVLGRVVPGVAAAGDAYDAYNRAKQGDYLGAGIAGIGAVGGMIPGAGLPVSLGAAGLNQAIDAYKRAPATPQQQAPATPFNNNKYDDEKGVDIPEPNSTTPNLRSAPSSGYKGSAGAQAIQQANADKITDVNKIKAGDTINLPGGGTYTIKPGDTLDQIAKNQTASPVTTQISTPTQNSNNDSEQSTQDSSINKPRFTPKSTTGANEKLPDEKISSTQADESTSLNRIKSLAGLK